VQKHSVDKDILKAIALPTKTKEVKKIPPPPRNKVTEVKHVSPDLRSTKPATATSAVTTTSPSRPVRDKTNQKPLQKKSSSVRLSGTPKKQAVKPNDNERPISETPDPRDIIDWLLQEKEKTPPQNQP
jgi:hypothetical protein